MGKTYYSNVIECVMIMKIPIYIDNIAFYLQKSGGITVVWKELLSRLISLYNNVFCLNYKYPPSNIFYDLIKGKVRVKYLKLFNLNIQRYFPVTLKGEKSTFIFHSTYYRYCTNPNAINITTVHDFTYEYFRSGIVKQIHCWQKYRAIRNSKYIICISQNTKQDLLKFVPECSEDKIRVIYNGVSNDYFPTSFWDDKIIPFNKNEYLLFVGARDSYKNFNFLVDALKNSNYKLVIVGGTLTSREINMLDLNLKANYFYAGRLSNEKLNILYNGAFAFVYPSAYEGFGIPVIEAQKAGCPVIAYNSSSIPEIIGDKTLLMNDLTKKDLFDKLLMISDPIKRKKIIEKGLINAQRFSWEQTFNEVIRVYNEAERL